MSENTLSEPKAKQIRSENDRPMRKERVPFGTPRTKLSVSRQVHGHHIHWVNDITGRVEEAEQAGYEFVRGSEIGSRDDEPVKRFVGTKEDGSALYAYLMKIKQEWYDEDQKEVQRAVDTVDSAIKSGSVDRQANDGRYVPKGGIKTSF